MAFTDIEIEYLTHEAQRCGREVLDDFHTNVHNNIVSFREAYGHVPEANLYASFIRDCAKEVVDAYMKRYVELAQELEKYPDGEDVKRLTDFTKPFVTELLPMYRRFANRPLGENIHADIVDATEKTLEFDLQTIFAKGLAPLMTLHMKGRVAEERGGLGLHNTAEETRTSLEVHNIYNTFNANVGAVQQGNDTTATITESLNVGKGSDRPED